jgi:hypothetical protein
MADKHYIVKYVEDEDEDNVKTYELFAPSKKKATDKVVDYIEENNHHPSINYGFTLTVKDWKISDPPADYVIN